MCTSDSVGATPGHPAASIWLRETLASALTSQPITTLCALPLRGNTTACAGPRPSRRTRRCGRARPSCATQRRRWRRCSAASWAWRPTRPQRRRSWRRSKSSRYAGRGGAGRGEKRPRAGGAVRMPERGITAKSGPIWLALAGRVAWRCLLLEWRHQQHQQGIVRPPASAAANSPSPRAAGALAAARAAADEPVRQRGQERVPARQRGAQGAAGQAGLGG